jgi:hypothetical protein
MCPICRTADLSLERVLSAALSTYSDVHARAVSEGNGQRATALFLLTWRRSTMMKIVMIAGATFALVTAAGAADLPHPQPVYQQAQLGKMPIGKAPIGKSPIGKAPLTRTY